MLPLPPALRRRPVLGATHRASSADRAALDLTVLRLRDLFLLTLLAASLFLPLPGLDRWDVALAVAGVLLPYNAVLRWVALRTGSAPRLMAVGDQVLVVGFVVLWPQLLAPVVVAGMLDVAAAAVLFERRVALRGALAGGTLLLLVVVATPLVGVDQAPEAAVVVPAYAIAALVTALTVGTVAGRERSSSRHLSELLDALHVVVYELDARTRDVRYVSPHVLALTGDSAEQLLGDPQRWTSRVHHADLPVLLQTVDRACEDGQAHQIDYRIFTADGRCKWVRNTAAADVDHHGRPLVRGCLTDVTAIKEAELALAEQARTDGLTGLANRAGLLAALDRCAALPAPGTPRLLAFLDLDSFKRVNDSLGHAAGDALLVQVAGRLRAAVPEGDAVARLGGDEFVVLMALGPDGDADHAVSHVLSAFEAPFPVDGRWLKVTASAGAVLVRGGRDAEGAETLLEHADAAMYEAKRNGSGHAFYNDRMRAEALTRLDLETELRTALDEEQFTLAYQPIVRAGDGQLLGYEALVRWQHPQRGTVCPGEFIEVAEQTGQIVELGRWTLRQACAQARRWGGGPLTVSVNLSARQLGDPALVGDVAAALHEADLAATSLTLEVTETALVSSPAQALTSLRALRALGVTVALDDFGTGYSSLSHLHRFPVDIVKIDRSFVHGVDDPDSDAHGIVAAILGLAAHMHLTVVAEGVETREQADALRRLHCERLQGYYYGRPGAPPAPLPLPRRDRDARVPAVA